MVDWLAGDPTGSGDADQLILGDLNAYAMEDPIDAIRAGADDAAGTPDDYTDLIARFGGDRAYGYVFDGQAGYLDHALAGASMLGQVTGATVWHLNADEPDILDYDTTFKQPAQEALYEPNGFRSSDHDPVIVGLDPETFDFTGILPPWSTSEPNVRLAGRALPVGFGLGGDFGADVLIDGHPTWQACDGGPVAAATLQNRPRVRADGNYELRVATSDSFAGTCQRLTVTLIDGSTASLIIEFV